MRRRVEEDEEDEEEPEEITDVVHNPTSALLTHPPATLRVKDVTLHLELFSYRNKIFSRNLTRRHLKSINRGQRAITVVGLDNDDPSAVDVRDSTFVEELEQEPENGSLCISARLSAYRKDTGQFAKLLEVNDKVWSKIYPLELSGVVLYNFQVWVGICPADEEGFEDLDCLPRIGVWTNQLDPTLLTNLSFLRALELFAPWEG